MPHVDWEAALSRNLQWHYMYPVSTTSCIIALLVVFHHLVKELASWAFENRMKNEEILFFLSWYPLKQIDAPFYADSWCPFLSFPYMPGPPAAKA